MSNSTPDPQSENFAMGNAPTPPPLSQTPAQTPDNTEQMQAMQDRINDLEAQVRSKNEQILAKNDQLHEAKKHKDDDGWSGCINLVLVLIAAIVLWIFCPSEEKMKVEMSRDIATQQMRSVASLMDLDQYRSNINSDHMTDTEAIEFAEKSVTYEIKNYGVVRLGYAKRKGKHKEHLAGIGICGFVITTSFIEDLRH